jgi:hypothetical protein
MPIKLRPGEDARRTSQAGEIVVDGRLDNARSIWLVGDEVHREGESQRAVGGAVEIGVDREVEVAGQHVAGIDEWSLWTGCMGAANGVTDVTFLTNPDCP